MIVAIGGVPDLDGGLSVIIKKLETLIHKTLRIANSAEPTSEKKRQWRAAQL